MQDFISNIQQNPTANETELKSRHERHIQDGNKQKKKKQKH